MLPWVPIRPVPSFPCVLWLLTLGWAAPAIGQIATAPVELREGVSGPFGPSVSGGGFGHRQVAADFNGDGYDDLAVSRTSGPSDNSAGLTHVLRGGSGGLTYWQTLSQFQTKQFGGALASCDLNGDGAADLIVGAPGTEVEGEADSGAVFVYLGSTLGLFYHQDLTHDDLGRVISGDDRFGHALATGDYDGDGACDVAIGAPEDDDTGNRGSTVNAGSVSVVFGIGNGSFSTNDSLHLRESSLSTSQSGVNSSSGDQFGWSLARAPGDAQGTGDRLLVGVPYKDSALLDDVGRVWLVEFSGRALLSDGSSFIDYTDDPAITGSVDGSERFGAALAAGRFVGSEPYAAVGAPRFTTSSDIARAGAVYLAALDDFGEAAPMSARISQEAPVLEGTPGPFERFGEVVHASDVDRDGWDDLIVGAPGDLDESTRGNSPNRTGAVHVLFGGQNFARFENRFGSAFTADSEGFGESLAVGNFFGDGGASVAVGSPDSDLPARGIGADERHGAVRIYRSTLSPLAVSLEVRTGSAPLGDGWLLKEISDPATTLAGELGYRGLFDLEGLEESRVVVGIERQSDGDVACASGGHVDAGFAAHSSSVFGYRDQVAPGCPSLGSSVSGVVGPLDFVAGDLTPVPGGAVGVPSGFVATSEERVYFLGFDFLSTARIFRTSVGAVGPPEVVVAEGDEVGAGTFVKAIDRFAVSSSGNHVAFHGLVGAIADYEAMVLDGAAVVPVGRDIPLPPTRGGDPTESILSFRNVAVDDSGEFLLAVTGSDDAHWLVRGDVGALRTSLRDSTVEAGGAVALEPLALSLHDGVALHLWGSVEGTPGSTKLLASCGEDVGEFDVILGSGDLVSTGSGAPIEVLEIHVPNSSEGLEISEDRRVFVRIDARQGADEFEAIVRLDLPCGIFADGFESGDISRWN